MATTTTKTTTKATREPSPTPATTSAPPPEDTPAVPASNDGDGDDNDSQEESVRGRRVSAPPADRRRPTPYCRYFTHPRAATFPSTGASQLPHDK